MIEIAWFHYYKEIRLVCYTISVTGGSSQSKSSGSMRMAGDRSGAQNNSNHRKSPSSGCESDDSVGGALDESGIVHVIMWNTVCMTMSHPV